MSHDINANVAMFLKTAQTIYGNVNLITLNNFFNCRYLLSLRDYESSGIGASGRKGSMRSSISRKMSIVPLASNPSTARRSSVAFKHTGSQQSAGNYLSVDRGGARRLSLSIVGARRASIANVKSRRLNKQTP